MKPNPLIDGKTSNIGITIHSRAAYNIDWHALLPANTRNNSLILIANPESIEKLTELDRKAFIAIYKTQSFDFDHLKVIFHKIHQEVYREGDKTKVSAVCEFDLIAAAELRDHFRELLSIDGPGLSTILNFRDKLQMKTILGNKGVPNSMDKKRPSPLPPVLLESYLLPETNTVISQHHFNRLETLDCTTSYHPKFYPKFFNKINWGIGAALMLSQSGDQTANNEKNYFPIKTEVDPILLYSLLMGSATIFGLLLYVLWRVSPLKETNENDENPNLSKRYP